MKKPGSFETRIRRAIKADGRSLYRIALDADIHIAPLQRFMAREHGLTLTTAEKLCRQVGLDLRPTKKA